MTNILIVSDTTQGVNWGGRGASLALQQILTRRFGGVKALSVDLAMTPVAINHALPLSIAAPLLARRSKSIFLEAYYRFEIACGMKPDFIELDPVESARNILRYRGRHVIRDLYEAIAAADTVVIDGDGDLIFRTPPGRIALFNLAMIELASQLGKDVHYVNSIFADCPVTGRNVQLHRHALSALAKCTTVAFRDPASVRAARSDAPNLDIELVPDSLFLWHDALQDAADNVPANGDYAIPFSEERPEYYGRLRFDRPYICVSGSSRAAVQQSDAAESYALLATRLRENFDMDVYLAPTCDGDRFLYQVADRTALPIMPPRVPIMMAAGVVAGAQVYVTGRYHPAIMASHGGTPCVFLGADSHKTASLQELLEYDQTRTFSALPTAEECDQICRMAAEHLQRGQDLRNRIRRAAFKRSREAERVADLVARSASVGASRRL